MFRASFTGSSYVGVFARASDEFVLLAPTVDSAVREGIEEELGVSAVETTIGGSGTVGSLAVANRAGVVLSRRATDEEIAAISDATDGTVARLPGRSNAAGNVVLANDHGAVVHPELDEDAASVVRETLDVSVERTRLADVATVGTAGVATNEGVLCHPQATEQQLQLVEDALDVYADLGTVNYGAPLVGSGVIANSVGYVVGEETTGPELGRIEETLGFVG